MKLSKWFMPLPHDKDGIYKWLLDTHFIENSVKRLMSYNDMHLYQDYLQCIYLQIFSIDEKLLIELSHNKIYFTNYIKRLIYHNIVSTNSASYRENKKWRSREIDFSDNELIELEETGEIIYSDGCNSYEMSILNK